jgi:hypothetical protein
MATINPPQTNNGSVVQTPPGASGQDRLSDYIIYIANTADSLPPWGTNARQRDKQLREFWPTEPVLAGALFSTAGRYAGFQWDLDGPERIVNIYTRILHASEHGRGWQAMMLPFLLDCLTQDNGGFIEVIRTDDSPTAPVLQLNHLDSNQCHRTGRPEIPVIYYDRQGDGHILKWYQVIAFTDMPSPIEKQNGRQYSALTRVLRAAQLVRDVQTYKRERATGQDTKQIHVVTGVSTQKIDDAISDARAQSVVEGFARYTRAVVVGSINPEAKASVATIDLAGLPDGYDEEKALRDYIIQLAMALGGDYQDFAPLPTGSMGSGSQSEVLALKARGKGPNLFMRGMEHLFNYHGLLPTNVTLSFGDQDAAQDLDATKLAAMRADMRAVQIKSGEISPEVARQIAVDVGDLDPKYLAELKDYKPMADIALEAKAKADASLGPKTGHQEGGKPATSLKTA